MNSSAIPTMNNCAIPTPTPFAAFFPVRASEKHEQKKTTLKTNPEPSLTQQTALTNDQYY
jgi:hypothetical protein